MWAALIRNPIAVLLALAFHIALAMLLFRINSNPSLVHAALPSVRQASVIKAQVIDLNKIKQRSARLAKVQEENRKAEQDAAAALVRQQKAEAQQKKRAQIRAAAIARKQLKAQKLAAVAEAKQQQQQKAAATIARQQIKSQKIAAAAEAKQKRLKAKRLAAARAKQEKLEQRKAAIAEQQEAQKLAAAQAKRQQQKAKRREQEQKKAAAIARQQEAEKLAAEDEAKGRLQEEQELATAIANKKQRHMEIDAAKLHNGSNRARKQSGYTNGVETSEKSEQTPRYRRGEVDELQAASDSARRQGQLDGAELRNVRRFIDRKIRANWMIPVGTQKLRCTLRVNITETGDVIDIKILESSGNRLFDNSVQRAVNNASPLPVPKTTRLFEASLKLVFDPSRN